MSDRNLNRFFLSIVLPSILAIGLFILSIFLVILPNFERAIMEEKKQMLSGLTQSVISLIEEYEEEARAGLIEPDSARALAVQRVRKIRYGDESKDYFWITDMEPVMLMHPYLPELDGKMLDEYADPEGKLLFVESVRLVEESGEGYIDYMWQWKDDASHIVPKLSFVKKFEAWEWVIGTGIYLEDVRLEIRSLKIRMLRVALLITVLITVILIFVIRASLMIENRRRKAVQDLRQSREKYRSLVEASTEGTLMLVDKEFIFSNIKFSELSGYSPLEVREKTFDDLFGLDRKEVESAFADPKKSVSREALLHCRDGKEKEVVISVSMIPHAGGTGYIMVVKELSRLVQFEKESKMLSAELQASLSWMNQALKSISREISVCPAETTTREAALIMSRKQESILFVKAGDDIMGVVTAGDLARRGMEPSAGDALESKVTGLMSAPVISLPERALMYEGLLLLKKKSVSHIALRRPDGSIGGVLGFREIVGAQQNLPDAMIREIETAEHIPQLERIYRRLPVLIKALIESGSNTDNITRIITSVSDAIHCRLADLAIEELGPPPCRFAFMVLGSQGRGEQTLATDQDNAIIIGEPVQSPKQSDGNTGKDPAAWFRELGTKLNEGLARIGYKKCPGDIMAGNPRWNKDLATWKGYFLDWVRNSDPQSILDTAIFFDFRCVYGDSRLAEELRDHVEQVSDRMGVFYYHMAQSVMKMKPPASVFGNIRLDSTSDEGMLDLKKLLLPVISYIRLHAIREAVREQGSVVRAGILKERKVLDRSLHDLLVHSFRYLTWLRIRHQAASISGNEPAGNEIKPGEMNSIEQAVLKRLISDISSLHTRLSAEFSGFAD